MTCEQLHLNIEKIIIIRDHCERFLNDEYQEEELVVGQDIYNLKELHELCQDMIYSDVSDINNIKVRDTAKLVEPIKELYSIYIQ